MGYTWENGRIWQPAPRRVAALPPGVVDVSAGADHSLALAGGAVYAWGRGDAGQLGDKSFVGPPRRVAALSRRRAVAVAARGACSCARFDDGGVACVGRCGRVRGALEAVLAGKVARL